MSGGFFDAMMFAGAALRSKGARLSHCGAGRLLFPVVWITNRCNLRCVMCDQWKSSPEEARRELSAGQWCSFIDSLKKMRAKVLVITGGEPLLRGDTPDIIRYATDKQINTHLCTNGTLLDERAVVRLRDSGLGSLSVSLDSAEAQTHDLIRGSVCQEKVVEHIRLLRSIAPSVRVGINCVITRHNILGLSRLAGLAVSLGVHQIRFDLIHRNLKHRNRDVLSFDPIAFKESDVPFLRKQIGGLKDELSRTSLLTNSRVYLNKVALSAGGAGQRLRCYSGYVSCAVDPMGWVSACDHMSGARNITEMPMEEIWRSREFVAQRRAVRQCSQRCWDSFHAEMNIRFAMRYCFHTAAQAVRETGYYLKRQGRGA